MTVSVVCTLLICCTDLGLLRDQLILALMQKSFFPSAACIVAQYSLRVGTVEYLEGHKGYLRGVCGSCTLNSTKDSFLRTTRTEILSLNVCEHSHG